MKEIQKVIISILSICIASIFLIVVLGITIGNEKVLDSDHSLIAGQCMENCNDAYLGVCFDNTSEYYMCDVIKEECNAESYRIVKVIREMDINNIRIYGSNTCPHCHKQLEEFGEYKDFMLENNLFVFCDLTDNEGCNDVRYVPSWKTDGEISNIGFINLDKLQS